MKHHITHTLSLVSVTFLFQRSASHG
jgi:hypothetical protein